MSDYSKAGGQAFPTPDVAEGISVRDYFAAAALQGLLASPVLSVKYAMEAEEDGDSPQDCFATYAYFFADAMLEERAQ